MKRRIKESEDKQEEGFGDERDAGTERGQERQLIHYMSVD